jgi:hypothetical protein
VTIDTLRLAKGLQNRGFTQQQAEGLAEELRDTIVSEVATKSDLTRLKYELILAMVGIDALALTIAKAIF